MDNYSHFLEIEPYDVSLLFIGIIVLAAIVIIPWLSTKRFITPPILFMAGGILVFLLPVEWPLPSLVNEPWLPERLTEIGVIIALTSVGLKINDPFSWKTWKVSWRLLVITMPLTVIISAFAGWWLLGLVPATALLFGAIIAPTDPVLAASVQTTKPNAEDRSPARIALTSEAGMNDGLAFPFTNLAIAVAVFGLSPDEWLLNWLIIDVVYKIAAGLILGAVSGWLIAFLLFTISKKKQSLLNMTGMVVLALTFLPYSITELVSGYGFIAVFISACMFRQQEAQHQYQDILHDFAVELEQVFIAVIMFLIGAYIAIGLLSIITIPIVLTALLTVFVVRTLAGIIALPGTSISWLRRWIISFYGIRGIGSLYYLAYALERGNFEQTDILWVLVVLIIMISVVVHGITAPYVMDKSEPDIIP
ncbi:MAG: cation:proton antiporter [Balneolaceae bacterium]